MSLSFQEFENGSDSLAMDKRYTEPERMEWTNPNAWNG